MKHTKISPLQATFLVVIVLVLGIGVVIANTSFDNNKTPVAVQTPNVTTPTPTAASGTIPFESCAGKQFSAPLQPLDEPKTVHVYSAEPAMTINTSLLYQVTIVTSDGNIVMCLQPDLAPVTVNNFVTLTRNHYYDGLIFHRVVAGFIIQGGDPNCTVANYSSTTSGCGQGGPGYKFNDEPVRESYVDGAVAMANSGPNSNGSQFFICIANDTSSLAASYNLFGEVESGLNVALQIKEGVVMTSVTVQQQA